MFVCKNKKKVRVMQVVFILKELLDEFNLQPLLAFFIKRFGVHFQLSFKCVAWKPF